jgi:RNA polymerase sigma factor (sigma-70 family)
MPGPVLVSSVGFEAFDTLSRRLRPALMRYFQRRTASVSDAEELVQELFLRLLRRADLFALENLDGYVFEAAANLARNRVRRQQARGGRHIDIADIEVGENIGARLQDDQAEADTRVARAKAEERRSFAIAREQEMKASTAENRSQVLRAEALVPKAMGEAFRAGRMASVAGSNGRPA